MDQLIRLYTFVTSNNEVRKAYSHYTLIQFETKHKVKVLEWTYSTEVWG